MKILTVDDELVSREKMKKIMTGFGKCESVDNGNAAVDIFRKALEDDEPFDADVADQGHSKNSFIDKNRLILYRWTLYRVMVNHESHR